MMYAANVGDKVIQMSAHLSNSIAGFDGGYTVTMHALPDYTFIVDAKNPELAVKCVVELCAKEGKKLSTDAATYQRRAD